MSERNEASRTVGTSEAVENETLGASTTVSVSSVVGTTACDFRALFDAANDAMVVLSGEQIIECNSSAERLFQGSRTSILGQTLLAFSVSVQPDGRDSSEKLSEKYARAYEGWPQTFDWAQQRIDGTPFFSELSLSRVPHADGVLILGIARDITDRKRAEEALRLNVHQLEANFENTPHVAIQWYDETGRVVYWNPASEAVFGWSVQDVLGQPLGRLMFTPEQVDNIILSLMEHSDTERAIEPTEYPIRRKDNSEGWVIATNFAIPMFSNQRGFVCMAVDITVQKRAEESLRQKEETFRALTESSVDYIMRFDEEGRLLYANPIASNKLGLSVVDEHRITHSMMGFSPEYGHLWDEALKDVFKTGNVRRLENEIEKGLWFDLLLMPEFDEAHQVRAVIVSARDVTARKNAEEERARLTEQLRQSTKMEAVGRLAGGVAHDFNNLLTAIKGSLNLALMDLNADSAIAEILRDANQASDSAAGLTRQLLAFSRKQPIMPQELDLNEVIVRMEKMLSRLIREDIELKTILCEELWEIHADRGQIEQIIVNLVVNAKDAMPGGGKLVLETRNAVLDQAYHAAHPRTPVGNFVMLLVSDTGCGMTAEVQSHLFEPFFTTKAVGLGTGLGLATTYGAVQQGGGSIDVDSASGVGTTFRIYLPRYEETAPPERVLVTEDELSYGTETILLVEDDDALRQLSEKLLKRLGYRVLVARDGAAAVKLATEYPERIDLLFCDIVLPGMNGKQVAVVVSAARPTTRVLFTSGYTDDVLIQYDVENPEASFIAKPFTLKDLSSKLRQILDRRISENCGIDTV